MFGVASIYVIPNLLIKRKSLPFSHFTILLVLYYRFFTHRSSSPPFALRKRARAACDRLNQHWATRRPVGRSGRAPSISIAFGP